MREWAPGKHGKGLLVRPRRDRPIADYELYTFDDRRFHADVIRELGVRARVVGYLLIWPNGSFTITGAGPAPPAAAEQAEIVQRLETRLDQTASPPTFEEIFGLEP